MSALTREDVIYGYQFILGREPESEAIIAHHMRMAVSFADFRRRLLGSHEFNFAAPEFLGMVPLPGFKRQELAIFDEFTPASVNATPGFITDFHGSRTRMTSLWKGTEHLDGKVYSKPIAGDYHGDAVEWLGLFKSVKAAGDQFVAMELGAFYGPWLIAGAVAARNRAVTGIHLVGVEPDGQRFSLMPQHFLDNGFDPKKHELFNAGVGPGCALSDVPIINLRDLVERRPVWDLVHMDIQGSEAEVCGSCVDLIKQRVRYLIIGTHSRSIEGKLLDMMFYGKFILENERPCLFNFNQNINRRLPK